MRKHFYFFTILLFSGGLLAAQHKHNPVFFDGYAIRNDKDTIICKILYDFSHPHIGNTVTLQIEGDQVSFPAGSLITAFGVYGDSAAHHYGFVSTNEMIYKRTTSQDLFLRKIVAGPISLYHYHFNTVMTKRKSTDGPMDKPETISEQSGASYYISKTDPEKPVLAKAQKVSSYRKKELEKYMEDNDSLYENAEKTLTLKEFIALIETYNKWYLSKKN